MCPRASLAPRRARGDVDAVGDERGSDASAVAPGLTEPQFFAWLSAVAMECKALTTKKAFGPSLPRMGPKAGREGQSTRGRAESSRATQSRSGSANARRNAARTIVMLQWMEVSRGMRDTNTNTKGGEGGIPPLHLSACLTT